MVISGGVAFSGCFREMSTVNHITSEVSGRDSGIGFDASLSSAVYGGSDTIMPPSINQPAVLYLGRPA